MLCSSISIYGNLHNDLLLFGITDVHLSPQTYFPSPQVSDLKENMLYQFQVRAANMAGVGIPSLPSETFICEEWTIAVPG